MESTTVDPEAAQAANLQEQLKAALADQAAITDKLKSAISNAESNPSLDAGLPEEYIKGFVNCGNVLAFEKNLYTVERENGEIVVKNIYQELVDKSAKAADKASRMRQALPPVPARAETTAPAVEAAVGGRRTRKQKKLSKKSLKKMSKKELLKMVKSMKKK
jgi:uncharacterized protein YdiU (UPF0061 family)